MGRKMLLAVLWCVSLGGAAAGAADAEPADSVAEASGPRLYRSVPAGMYASASPYASFSFHVPTFAASPELHRGGPIQQASAIVQNTQGYLTDSYGNKFVESPQSPPYRAALPQQYVQLQELPAHLARPLVAAAPSFQYKQVTPHFFGPSQFKVEANQAASPSASRPYAVNQPYSFGQIRSAAPAQQQQRPSSNKANYAHEPDRDQYQGLQNVGKSQRLEENPHPYISNTNEGHHGQRDRAQLKSVASTNKGRNAAVKLETNPPVPLLDLTLLEPLTFENPLVPQVQHFLPRISSATYQKLPELNLKEVKTKMKEIMIQKTKSYESVDPPEVNSQRQQQHRPHSDEEEEEDERDSPRDVPEGEVELSYKSPNYKESYNEKVLNYNKETEMEPVHYSYAMKSDKEPLTYNYARSTKAPYKEHVKDENNDDGGQKPKHLIYKFKPEESDEENSDEQNSKQSESEDSSEQDSKNEAPVRLVQKNQNKGYKKETHNDEGPEHREENHRRKPESIVNKQEEQYYRKPDKIVHQNLHRDNPQEQVETISTHNPKGHLKPVLKEYEEDIRIAPAPKEYETIKVDPNQHIKPQSHEARESENPDDREQYRPEQHVEEKGKSIIITEETPNPNSKEINDESGEPDGRNEEEFEKGYKNAAYGFPAYQSRDTEKEIYNPEPYAPARYNSQFDVEHNPFERYVADSDEYPKSTRSNYKDAKDKTKERYYLDYAVSKPESMLARYKQKEDYYKMYMDRRPEYLEGDGEKKNDKTAKYTAAPGYDYHAAAQKPKQYYTKYKAAPRSQAYEYNYAKEAPKDSSAHATGPYQRLKTFTQFVEPQFQYGYEQSALPRLLDSELAAMASNLSPHEKQPLMRKKVYKENWYIKKTSTGKKADS